MSIYFFLFPLAKTNIVIYNIGKQSTRRKIMKLNAIFASNMVFAANKPIRIYGNGNGRAEISFAGSVKEVVSENGSWLVEFPEMDYGGPYELTFKSETGTVILSDIYVGEVYLFAGQSNMQFKLSESSTPPEKHESNDLVRLFSTDRIEKADRFTPDDGWVKCEKDQAKYWSAIGYLTSMQIAKQKGVAIGAIVCYQGASVIESWVPAGTYTKMGIELKPEEKHQDHFYKEFSEWNGDGVLYSFGFSQIAPFSLSAVVWYQGESDSTVEEARVYKQELAEMINIWRKDLKNDDLPFIVVQIADYDPRDDEGWHTIQRAQADISKELDNVKTVISADVCEKDNIHPPTKDILSERIAKALTE